MSKKKKSILGMFLLLIILLLVFVMCAPQTSSGGGGSSNNNDTSKYYWAEDTTNWNKKFDGNGGQDEAYSVAIDSNNNVYVVGRGSNIVSGGSGRDWWIKKFDSNGNENTTSWNKKFDGDSAYANSVAIDSNNNVYVVGYGESLVSGSSGFDWWIKKFNSNGNEDTTNWNKKFDGNGGQDEAYSVAIDSNNNVYVVGYGGNIVTGITGADWWIKKFDSNGNEDTSNWNKKIDWDYGYNVANSVAIDSNNNVYVVGYGEDLVSGSSVYDWWIKKFNSNGNEDTTNWNKKFDGNGGQDEANSVAIDSNNNVYIIGCGYNLVSGSSVFDWWIKKFDSNGNEDTTNWNKMFDESGEDRAYSIAIDSNNNVYVVGYGKNLISSINPFSNLDWWIKKFDSNGSEDTTNWNKMFDGNRGDDCTYSVAIDSNDNVYAVGYGQNIVTSSSGLDWWIKKFIKVNL